ncbi:MAG: DUF1385 domain-containing protein [Clostridia bacterium]|nr:DUF1385 domain-containing protein [Clostridia bacterium]
MSQQQSCKKTSIGGQALIEGVMMRGPRKSAMAVRQSTGSITVETWPTGGQDRARIWKVPLIRGVYNMIDSLRGGYKCLMRSAELAGLEEIASAAAKPEDKQPETVPTEPEATQPETAPEETPEAVPVDEPPAAAAPEETPAAPERKEPETPKQKTNFEKYGMPVIMVVSTVLGVAISLALFMYLPIKLYGWVAGALDNAYGWDLTGNRFLRSVCEGLLRILIFIAYLAAVSLIKDMRRVFMYHGAEHKTIFCYEHGLELTVENVRKEKRFHPRCGTSFMVLMLIVGIFVSIFIPVTQPVLRTLLKLLTLPVVVGVGYELIKWAGRRDNCVRASSPNRVCGCSG